MSITDELRRRVDEGRLVVHTPALAGRRTRAVLLDAELHRELINATSLEANGRVGMLVRDLDRIVNGSPIVVGYGRDKQCFLKQLAPLEEEIWEIRSRDPKPAWRVFCRFAKPDVLLALNAMRRSELGAEGSIQWGDAIRLCKTRWRQLLPTYSPFSGRNAREYISDSVVVLNDVP